MPLQRTLPSTRRLKCSQFVQKHAETDSRKRDNDMIFKKKRNIFYLSEKRSNEFQQKETVASSSLKQFLHASKQKSFVFVNDTTRQICDCMKSCDFLVKGHKTTQIDFFSSLAMQICVPKDPFFDLAEIALTSICKSKL